MTAEAPAAAAAPRATGDELVPTECPVCGADEADPVAVGGDFDREGGETYLAVRCGTCGLIYLNPAPPAQALVRPGSRSGHALSPPTEEDGRWRRGLPPGARVLRVTRDQPLEPTGAPFDRIVLDRALEHSPGPLQLLASVRRALRPGGTAVVIAYNAGSAAFDAFGGRHWAGYHFPATRQFFTAGSICRLAARAGFAADGVGTAAAPADWRDSVDRLARDWGLPAPVRRLVAGTRALWPIIEALHRSRGRGARLVATLRRVD